MPVGALGLQVVHSGTIVGLLFDPGSCSLSERIAEAPGCLAEIGIHSTCRLCTSTECTAEEKLVAVG